MPPTLSIIDPSDLAAGLNMWESRDRGPSMLSMYHVHFYFGDQLPCMAFILFFDTTLPEKLQLFRLKSRLLFQHLNQFGAMEKQLLTGPGYGFILYPKDIGPFQVTYELEP